MNKTEWNKRNKTEQIRLESEMPDRIEYDMKDRTRKTWRKMSKINKRDGIC